jgi:transcriptional regulator NrdR family protein
MKCPKCRGKTCVKDSRSFGKLVKRNRACLKCGTRFVTYEEISHIIGEGEEEEEIRTEGVNNDYSRKRIKSLSW